MQHINAEVQIFDIRCVHRPLEFPGTKQMPLKIFLSSSLRKYVPGYDPNKGVSFIVGGEKTVTDICDQMNIPADKIKIIMINGKSQSPDYVLKGDERVGLFPPVGGG